MLTEKDILQMIVQQHPDGSKTVDMGRSETAQQLSPMSRVEVKVDTAMQQITISTYNLEDIAGSSQSSSRSVTYGFAQFRNEFPLVGSNMTFSTEGGISFDAQQALGVAGKTAYVAGIFTAEVSRHMGAVSYFRPIVDGWGKVYPATSRWRYSIIPGNTASKIARMAKPVALAGAGITLAYDWVGYNIWLDDPNNPNAVHPAKFSLDMFFSGIGFTGWGSTASILYFGVDGFYPGGWAQALEDRAKREKEVQKIIPGYREVPYGPKW